jgi:carboxyl-terminal processing protease
MLRTLTVFSLACVAALALSVAPATAEGGEDLTAEQRANVEVLDAVLARIRANFFDREFCGIDLADLRARHLSNVLDAKPGHDLHAALRGMLGEFKVSHLTVVSSDVFERFFAPEMNDTQTVQAGFSLVELEPGRLFVAEVLHGSAADNAGLKRGDQVVRINSQPALGSGVLVDAGGDPGMPGKPAYFVMPREGEDLHLDVRRVPDSDVLESVTVTPAPTSMIEATRNSIKVLEIDGRRIGYIRCWHFLHSGITNALRRAINNDFADCDGMIIDLRGRGGSPLVMNACFMPFGEPPPMRGLRRLRMPSWDRPVVALQDRGSRSAKEVYSHNWQWLDIGPVVGESTPGAVLASEFFTLPDGSRLLYPMQRADRFTYGEVNLEGNPVRPTHPVKDLLPYAAGADTIKAAGIKVLAGMLEPIEAPQPQPKEEPQEEHFAK